MATKNKDGRTAPTLNGGQGAAAGRSRPRATEDLHREFRNLVAQWREETFGQSLAAPGVLNPAYLRIIGMGERALPWILDELEESGGQWYVALQSITGEDPVPEEDRGHRPKMRAAWREWGRRNGWID